jgi:hypothetical protein
VTLYPNVLFFKATEAGGKVADLNGERFVVPADTVVMATASVSNWEFLQ